MSVVRRLFYVWAIGVLTVLATSATAAAATGTFYVNGKTGNDKDPCTAPGAPCKTIQAAVEKAEAAPEDETATIEAAAGVYTELVTLGAAAAGVTINGAGSGLGGTEIEGPEPTGNDTVSINVPGSAVGLSNLSIVNDQAADTGKGLKVEGAATLTNVVVTMEEAVLADGIEVSSLGGSLTMRGGGVTMEAGTEGSAIIAGPGAPLDLEGASILVSTGSKAGGVDTVFGPVTITKSVVNMASTVSTRPGILTNGGAISLAEDTIIENGTAGGSNAIFALMPAPFSGRALNVTMSNAASKAFAVAAAIGTATVEGLTVGGSWAGTAFFAEGGNTVLADSRLNLGPGSTSAVVAYLAGSETPGLVVRRSVLQGTPTSFASLFTSNTNLTLDSSEVLGGKNAIVDEVASKTKTVTVAASTIDAANLGVADGGAVRDVVAIAGKGNSIVNVGIEGSILLEPQLALVGVEGHSAKIACSNSDVPSQSQAEGGGNGAIECATGAAGNTQTEPASLFAAPITEYQLSPASPAIDSVPAGAISLPFGLTPSSTDLAGNARVLDGNGDCLAAQDRGAIELQGHAAACPPAPAPGGGPPPAAKPLLGVISGLTVSPSSFFAAPSGATISAAKRKYGAKVSWRDTQAATTKFTVLRVSSGRRQGKSCRRPSKSNKRGKRCTLLTALGGFAHKDLAGTNSVHFSGRLKGKRLTAGQYRLRAVPHDAAGNGAAVTKSFTIK
jgi:hypothetical protein